MAPKTSDDKLGYVMLVLNHCDSFQPNYHAIANAAGMSSANIAQKAFKKIVEDAGFALVAGSVTKPSEAQAPKVPATPKTPKVKSNVSTPATPVAKKRKAVELDKSGEDDHGSED